MARILRIIAARKRRTTRPVFDSPLPILLFLMASFSSCQAWVPPTNNGALSLGSRFYPSQRKRQTRNQRHPRLPASDSVLTVLADESQQQTDPSSLQQQDEVNEMEENDERDSSSSVSSSTNNAAAVAARKAFHDDMRRVLQTRRGNLPQDGDTENRIRKPVVLTVDVDGAQRCYTMLRHLQQQQQQKQQKQQRGLRQRHYNAVTADEESYQIVMQAFLNRGRLRWRDERSNINRIICAADQLEQLREEYIIQSSSLSSTDTSSSDVPSVSIETNNLVLQAYAVCATPRGGRQYAERAHELLRQMIKDSNSDNVNTVPVESLLHVLHAYAWQQANRQEPDCAQAAEALLEQIILRSQQETETTTNDSNNNDEIVMQGYAYVLEAYSKSLNGGSKCQELFERMKQLASNSNSLLDAQVYSNAVLAWSKQEPPTAQSAENAYTLLLELVDLYKKGAGAIKGEPPLIAFNGVITVYGKLGQCDQAEQVLWIMDDLVQHNCTTHLVPDVVSYNSILHGILRSSNSDKKAALQKSLALVQYMQDNCKAQPAIAPNAFSYHTLIKCWIQQDKGGGNSIGDCAHEAELLLHKIEALWDAGDETLERTNRVYNMVMNAYAKTRHRYAGERALELLQRMKAYCQPDIISYTSAIECVSKSPPSDGGYNDAPALAESLLLEAESLYERTGDPALMPNLRTYTMTIQTFAQNSGNVTAARALLTQLVEKYEATRDPELRPNTFPYNYVLNCAANTPFNPDGNKIEAFQIASQTYQDLRKSKLVQPDSYSYAFWLKCCNNLLMRQQQQQQDSKVSGISHSDSSSNNIDLLEKCVRYAFEECKAQGLVTSEVLTRLFQGSPKELVDELLEIEHSNTNTNNNNNNKQRKINYRGMQVQDLPAEWSRKTKTRRWKYR